MAHDGTYRAHVGDRSLGIRFEEGQLHLDDREADFAFEHISGSRYALRLDGRSEPAVVEPQSDGTLRVTLRGRQYAVRVQDERALLLERFGLAEEAAASERTVRAPMPGLVLSVEVEEGQDVEEGAGLLVLEAMKMENELSAQASGTVKAVHVAAGDAVGKNELLIEME